MTVYHTAIGDDIEGSFDSLTKAVDEALVRAYSLCAYSGSPESVYVLDDKLNRLGVARARVTVDYFKQTDN